MDRLNGWQRMGIILSILWLGIMGVECWIEQAQGPFASGWLTDTIIIKTAEPIAVLKDNPFRDLVPVDQVVNWKRFLLSVIVPVISMWALGFSLASVRDGFRKSPKSELSTEIFESFLQLYPKQTCMASPTLGGSLWRVESGDQVRSSMQPHCLRFRK